MAFNKNPLVDGVVREINEYSGDLEGRIEASVSEIDAKVTDLSVDFVVEQGPTYCKRKSGRFEQWGTIINTDAINIAIGSGYRTGSLSFTFPIPFATVDQVQLTSRNYTMSSVTGLNPTTLYYSILCFDSGRKADYIFWYAIGTWK